ncbi:hypothetical protein FJT64_001865 [Amphibalanus amphitrite]|uniref:Uncharacterized protein n=1 Tax=Amphibalanus amphitrite TaxID=1232801 RepID=A0A6A4WYD5_AMPAM|nr:hypothetical protein FJT64_001865 [Amphibalanus amphitrite]
MTDCTDHTAGSLEPLTRCRELRCLSVTAADLPLLNGQLPGGLRRLNVRGPEVTEPRWPVWDECGLSVSLQGVTADTISHLADLGRTVKVLEIYDFTDHTAGSLEPLTRRLHQGRPELEFTPLMRDPKCATFVTEEICEQLRRRAAAEDSDSGVEVEVSDAKDGAAGGAPSASGGSALSKLNEETHAYCRGAAPPAGPEVTELRWPEWDLGGGLSVSLQGVAADTISHLADLGRTVTGLEIYDCPDLTAGSLETLTRCPELWVITLSGGVPDTVSLEPLTRCPKLERLTLSGGVPDAVSLEPLTRCPELRYLTLSGGITNTVSLEPLTRCPRLYILTLSGGVPDAVLDSLSGWPGLWYLTLGDRQRPAETAFTAAAVTRLVKSCQELGTLCLHCTADTGRAVLTALKEADLGRRSDGRPRTIGLGVPEELYDQLESQEGGRVWVWKWEDWLP